jgi:hypothetical protein
MGLNRAARASLLLLFLGAAGCFPPRADAPAYHELVMGDLRPRVIAKNRPGRREVNLRVEAVRGRVEVRADKARLALLHEGERYAGTPVAREISLVARSGMVRVRYWVERTDR